jgi:demethylmenaquinone methyltransferase / 2-methoxy-6-polyprenyl-1,4-benzoquinol methylase
MQEPSRAAVEDMFDQIAPGYDLGNSILTFGLDARWRQQFVIGLKAPRGSEVLDAATGTGDVALTLLRYCPDVHVEAIDFSQKMIEIAQQRLSIPVARGDVHMSREDVQSLPYEDNFFDAVTIAYGIRNVVDVEVALKELYRVLKPGGTIGVLEFSMPKGTIVRTFSLFYLRRVLPIVGRVVTGRRRAFEYLDETIETFPHGKAFLDLLKGAKFTDLRSTKIALGITTAYYGKK